MRTILAGLRSARQLPALQRAIEHAGWTPTAVLSQGSPAHAAWAAMNAVPVETHATKWEVYGAARAARSRNVEMATHADALIACWDGKSPGTRHMIETARRMGLRVHVERIERDRKQ